MPQPQMLNNILHKDLRVVTKKSKVYGDNVGGSVVFPNEFTDVQKEYPILFQKNTESGEFQAVAIFSFNKDENLFLDEQGWHASYIPIVMEREPFLIGFQQDFTTSEKMPVIHVDMESPRISQGLEGEPVFLQHGGNSPYIERISKMLMMIHEGVAISKDMFSVYLSLDLIESFVLDIEFNDSVRYQSSAYYTINEEKLFSLDESSLTKLHQCGYLHYAYMVIASLGNIKKMINMYNKRHAQ